MHARMKWLAALVATAVLTIGMVSASGRAGAEELPVVFAQCGDVITQSAKLGNNITGCKAPIGLLIQGDGITLDLAGHTVQGFDLEYQIGIFADHGSKIRNGTVRDWHHGVQVQEKVGGVVRDIVATSNVNAGIVVNGGSSDVTLRDNKAIGNQGSGIILSFATHVTLIGNRAKTNAGDGFELYHSSSNRMEENVAAANAAMGVRSTASDENMLIGNTFEGNSRGVYMADGSEHNTVEGNEILANVLGVYLSASDSNIVRLNAVKKNSMGLFVNSLSETNTLAKNVVNDNAIVGIVTEDATTVLKSNTANKNGFSGGIDDDQGLGIDAPVGAEGFGNVATGNDDPEQCLPQPLCS